MLPIGRTIKEFRLLRGMSLNQVAEIADMDKSYLSKIENEKRDPSLTSLTHISKAIDVPLNILILMCEDTTNSPFAEIMESFKSLARDIVRDDSKA